MCYYSELIGLDENLREIAGQTKVVKSGDKIVSKRLSEIIGFVCADNQNCLACITPGATVRLMNLPVYMRNRWSCGPSVELTFEQLDPDKNYNAERDRFLLPSGTSIALNALPSGLQGEVVFATAEEKTTFMALHAIGEAAAFKVNFDRQVRIKKVVKKAAVTACFIIACAIAL